MWFSLQTSWLAQSRTWEEFLVIKCCNAKCTSTDSVKSWPVDQLRKVAFLHSQVGGIQNWDKQNCKHTDFSMPAWQTWRSYVGNKSRLMAKSEEYVANAVKTLDDSSCFIQQNTQIISLHASKRIIMNNIIRKNCRKPNS